MDHPGTNNLFEIKTRSKLSTLYNDQSVLENHHCASFFFLIENQAMSCDVMELLSKDERAMARKILVESILATDMSKHHQI